MGAGAASTLKVNVFKNPPQPPYIAVIFSSQRTDGDNGYGLMADRMAELAAQQPGFLGVECVRGADGFGITVSYWQDEMSIAAWKRNTEHSEAQHKGKAQWYDSYVTHVARVERVYSEPRG